MLCNFAKLFFLEFSKNFNFVFCENFAKFWENFVKHEINYFAKIS